MDAFVQGLKRAAQTSGDASAIWRYAWALERIISEECSDLKLWQIMGHDGDVRPLYYCVARDEAGVRSQFEETLANTNSWGRVLWDHVFEDYAGFNSRSITSISKDTIEKVPSYQNEVNKRNYLAFYM